MAAAVCSCGLCVVLFSTYAHKMCCHTTHGPMHPHAHKHWKHQQLWGHPSPWAHSLGATAGTCPVHATHNWHGMAEWGATVGAASQGCVPGARLVCARFLFSLDLSQLPTHAKIARCADVLNLLAMIADYSTLL